ncbi:Fpg/Nei family DNA glycosylase [Marisediminicola senii]|uniref:Fpg/Nei family DNA glycosylase n=1 Tax=Marisediminicola senii TaxID=2711233 RepID=UPI0013E9B7CD|nr:DNA-formamidopyrimidine glycosylase family protein [Marisediminicola senii]
MPEGHSVHRIARQFGLHFVGRTVAASSPQGRFAAGATEIDGHRIIDARAVGKQMFLEFDHGRWLRVHLGMYGAWDFAGDVTADATTEASGGRMGQTGQRGIPATEALETGSIGAPRGTRLRMAEQEALMNLLDGQDGRTFPPEPVGAVRVRLLTDITVADLRGPTACEVLSPEEVQAVIAKLGPDPLVDPGKKSENRFVATVAKKPTPIGLLLMDQTVISGIGNVYRAELLFRARLDPHTPGRDVPEETVRALWKDWTKLLKLGVKLGQMMTMDGLSKKKYTEALAHRDSRHWVYHREGKPCRVCGTPIAMEMAAGRKLYWCPVDQAPAGSPPVGARADRA